MNFRMYQASLSLMVLLNYIKLFPKKVVNVLLSFGLVRNEFLDFLGKHRDKFGSLIFDCGAYSQNKSKGMDVSYISLDSYKDYLLTHGELFDFYFNLDSDFSEDGFSNNLYNQMMLEDAGLTPVPVVHNIYNEEIDYYLEHGYQRIGLGSPQINRQDDVAHVMRRTHGSRVSLHALGQTGFDLLAYFPINSADSAMWARTGGWGYLSYWNPEKQGPDKTDKIYLQEFLHADRTNKVDFFNYEFRKDFEAYLKHNFGLKYYDFFGRGGAYNKMLVNLHYLVTLEEVINRMHLELGF